jgi:hypothetical protein
LDKSYCGIFRQFKKGRIKKYNGWEKGSHFSVFMDNIKITNLNPSISELSKVNYSIHTGQYWYC